MRSLVLVLAGAVLALPAAAQEPAAGPVVLLLPVSPRLTGLGGASNRDDYSIFYNPARIAPTNGIGIAFGRYGFNGTSAAVANTAKVGSLNLGWGLEMAQFRASTNAPYPFTPADLAFDGTRPTISLAADVAAEYTLKRFSLGVGVKFAEDRVDATNNFPSVAPPSAIQRNLMLADVGATHALWGGTAEVAVLNIGDRSSYPTPTIAKLGFSRSLSTRQLDFLFAADATEHDGWYGGGGGAEMGWGWIEGWSIALRAGARRPESAEQRPMTVGATLNADRLALDYALEFFEGNRYAHILAVRWR
jgi:hypothetical protein